jgi:hypothetical protein
MHWCSWLDWSRCQGFIGRDPFIQLLHHLQRRYGRGLVRKLSERYRGPTATDMYSVVQSSARRSARPTVPGSTYY